MRSGVASVGANKVSRNVPGGINLSQSRHGSEMKLKVTLVRSRSTDAATLRVATNLSRVGYDVELIVWDRGGHFLADIEPGCRLRRFPLRVPYDRPSAVLFLPFWWAYETLALLAHNADIIHACDLDTLYPAILSKFAKKAKLCYTIYDFYANNVHVQGLPRVAKVLRHFIASAERLGMGFADALFIPDESRLKEIKVPRSRRVTLLYNSPEDVISATVTSKNRSDRDFHIFYAGVLAWAARGLGHMVEAVRNLEGVTLTLAGTGPDEALFEEVTRELTNVRFVGWIPSYQEVLRREMESDLLFRFIDPNIPKSRYESPNKLFEAMMCSKPIMVSDGGRMADLVIAEECGLVVRFGDVIGIRNAIVKLRDDPALRAQLGKNGRRAYEQRYNGDEMTRRLLAAYKDLGRSSDATKR